MNIIFIKNINKHSLDGDYSKGIIFYKSAIDKLRRYCQTLSNAVEKKRGIEVCFIHIDHIYVFHCSV